MRVRSWISGCVAVASIAMTMHAVTAAEGPELDGGFDLRLRQEMFNNIPISADPPGITRGGLNDYFRVLTRFWGSIGTEGEWTLMGRMANEFRHYRRPDNDQWDFPDEWVVDLLYLDVYGLGDGLVDLRVGRQDLIYGAGRVVLEGNPKDGSRCIFFDAAKISLHATPLTRIDLLGIYNRSDAKLLINDQDRDIIGYTGGHNDATEKALGIYALSREIESIPFELYYFYKIEDNWVTGAGDAMPKRDIHTVGTRVLPKISDSLAAEVELAFQEGNIDDELDRASRGQMAYAGLTFSPPTDAAYRPYVTAAWYYLSGDDPDKTDDTGWNPLFARYPQFSELYIYAWDADSAGRWSNISYPHLEIGMRRSRMARAYLQVGRLMAPEKNGPGDGDLRGWLGVARWDFPIRTGMTGWFANGGERRDVLFGHLLAEVLDPGDYYEVSDLAYFLRWELTYRF